MSEINLHNYEAFLLDYFEGNLNENKIVELKSFIQAHPELEINLEDTELIGLDRAVEPFEFKNNLKKINEGKEDDLIIAYLENQLSAQEKLDFEKRLLTDHQLLAQLNAYKKTILTTDDHTFFTAQNKIYKTEDDLVLNNKHIAYLEGLLSEEEMKNFESELKHKIDLQREFSLYQKSYLQKDISVVFPYKSDLKKENKVLVLFSYRNLSRMAAVLLLLIGFFIFIKFTKQTLFKKNIQLL